MMKLSDLRPADEIHEQDMQDQEYRREYERTKVATDVAIKVIQYRVDHGLSQIHVARPACITAAQEEALVIGTPQAQRIADRRHTGCGPVGLVRIVNMQRCRQMAHCGVKGGVPRLRRVHDLFDPQGLVPRWRSE